MKWKRFEDKLPELGTIVLVAHEEGGMIAILEFGLQTRKYLLKEYEGGYYPQEYYSDDPSEIHEYDLRRSDFWAYPSSIKLPKKI